MGLLNDHHISALIVVDGGKPVGIVHFHDLLQDRRGLKRFRAVACGVDDGRRQAGSTISSRSVATADLTRTCAPAGRSGPETRHIVSPMRTRPRPSLIGSVSVASGRSSARCAG